MKTSRHKGRAILLGPTWTAEEDALVRKLYPRSVRRLLRLLPHRTANALRSRASKLALPRPKRAWTKSEDRLLAMEWGEIGHRSFRMKLPGRTWGAIVDRAAFLQLGTPAQESISLTEACRRMGYDKKTLRVILSEQGVAITSFKGGPRADSRQHPRWCVDPVEVRDAVERHLAARGATETLTAGAARHGVDSSTLRRRLALIDVSPPSARGCSVRLDPAVVDRAMALQTVPGRRLPGTLRAACVRAGVSYATAKKHIHRTGRTGRRGLAHSPDVVSQVVAELTARSRGDGVRSSDALPSRRGSDRQFLADPSSFAQVSGVRNVGSAGSPGAGASSWSAP